MTENGRDVEALERELLKQGTRRNRERLRELLAEEFREFGRSGRVYDREAVLDVVIGENAAELRAWDFRWTELAERIGVLTYRSERTGLENTTQALRSSIWVWRDGRWQMIFHQGTRVDTER